MSLATYAALGGAALLFQDFLFSDWRGFAVWIGMCVASIAVANWSVRCPHCGAALPREVGRFAYIRCQACRRRFDGREGPDPEVSDEALAGGDPMLLRVYRDESAELNRLIRARTDPAAREALLADLEGQAQQHEAELQRRQAVAGEAEICEFLRHELERIRQEIIELRQLRRTA